LRNLSWQLNKQLLVTKRTVLHSWNVPFIRQAMEKNLMEKYTDQKRLLQASLFVAFVRSPFIIFSDNSGWQLICCKFFLSTKNTHIKGICRRSV